MTDPRKIFAADVVKLFTNREASGGTLWRVQAVENATLNLASHGELRGALPPAGAVVFLLAAQRDAAYVQPARVVESQSDGQGARMKVRCEGEQERVQRRRNFRVTLALPAKMIEIIPEAVRPMQLETEDVSAGGLRVLCPRAITKGQLVLTTVDLGDGQPPVICQSKVVRCEPTGTGEYEVGVSFVGLHSKDEDRLVSLLTSTTRAHLHRRQDEA